MTRRPKVGGKPIKGRLPNAQKPRRSKMAKAAPRSMSSSSRDQTEVTRLTCELNAAIERQNATAEILASVSRSSTDTRPVFDAILDNLLRLFGQAHPFVDNGTFCFSSSIGVEMLQLGNCPTALLHTARQFSTPCRQTRRRSDIGGNWPVEVSVIHCHFLRQLGRVDFCGIDFDELFLGVRIFSSSMLVRRCLADSESGRAPVLVISPCPPRPARCA